VTGRRPSAWRLGYARLRRSLARAEARFATGRRRSAGRPRWPSLFLRRTVRATAISAVTTILALGSGPAFAYFAVGVGVGSGGATTGTLKPLVVQPATVGSPSTLLLPGATADLVLNLTNPNPFTVTILSVTQAGGVTVTGGTGCSSDLAWPGTLGNSGVSLQAATGLSITIAGGATDVVHLAGAATIATTSAMGCQGATFQIPVAVTVKQ